MREFFSYPYSGGAFVQWRVAHLGALLVIALLVLSFRRFPSGAGARRAIRPGLALLLLGKELFWHAWHARTPASTTPSAVVDES